MGKNSFWRIWYFHWARQQRLWLVVIQNRRKPQPYLRRRSWDRSLPGSWAFQYQKLSDVSSGKARETRAAQRRYQWDTIIVLSRGDSDWWSMSWIGNLLFWMNEVILLIENITTGFFWVSSLFLALLYYLKQQLSPSLVFTSATSTRARVNASKRVFISLWKRACRRHKQRCKDQDFSMCLRLYLPSLVSYENGTKGKQTVSCDVPPMKKIRSRFHSQPRVVRENIELVNLCLCRVPRDCERSWNLYELFTSWKHIKDVFGPLNDFPLCIISFFLYLWDYTQ